MNYKGIIFDLDGVICYSDKFHYEAWKRIAEEEGICFDENVNARLRGVSRMESLDIILEKAKRTYSDVEKKELADKKNSYYVKLLENMSTEHMAFGVKETLESLKSAGIKTAIGSSSKNTRLIMDKLKLSSYFDAVSDGTMIRNSKPDPEVFLKAAELLQLSPSECLVVEDAVAGIEAAVRGGFAAAAIGDAWKHEEAAYKIQTLSELINIVK
ncbi:MAG: beta-phosphoglucomutase [Lachnospiraceae bacterium]|nr:beta-phosphoglucomutase [Lachnospiraceae bacterium]